MFDIEGLVLAPDHAPPSKAQTEQYKSPYSMRTANDRRSVYDIHNHMHSHANGRLPWWAL